MKTVLAWTAIFAFCCGSCLLVNCCEVVFPSYGDGTTSTCWSQKWGSRQSHGPTFTSPTVNNGKWTEEFTSQTDLLNGWRWTSTHTSAYICGDHNPGWNKLDWVVSHAYHLEVDPNGHQITFKAALSNPPKTFENGKIAYNSGSLTTQYSEEQFMVKTGNYIETYVQLPNTQGAWPCLFTWKPETGKPGANEVDVFEYHFDKPDVLELTSHLWDRTADKEDPCFIKDNGSSVIGPAKWIKIGLHLGKDYVKWYLNGNTTEACTKKGVGSDTWTAFLVMHLAVSEGVCQDWHKQPTGTEVMWYRAKYVRVYDTIDTPRSP